MEGSLLERTEVLSLLLYSSRILFKGLQATNEWQDDGTGVLHQVVQHPIDQVYLYMRHSCPSPPKQDLEAGADPGFFEGGGGLCPEVGQLGVVGIGECSQPLQLGVLGW